MADKELLERLEKLKELLNERKDMLEKQNNQGNQNINKLEEKGGNQKTLGGHPQGGNISTTNEEYDNPQKGYSSIFMLCFLTFFFEVLFLIICYFIFR